MSGTTLKARMLEAFRVRVYIVSSIMILFFLAIIIQLFYLQIIKQQDFAKQSKSNMENYIPILAPRGEIYDCNIPPAVLASNRSSFNICLIKNDFKSKRELKKVLGSLASLLKVELEYLWNKANQANPWEKVVLKEDVDFDLIVKIASYPEIFKNISWQELPMRSYPYKNMLSHLIGFVGQINQKEYQDLKASGYKYYHKVGKIGLEKEYDQFLRGEDGSRRRIVDVQNRVEFEEVEVEPKAGHNLVLTIDQRIQEELDHCLNGLKGAGVVLRAVTGEILALTSKPDFDPNLIISKDNETVIQNLLKDKDNPFLDRSIQARYSPASTFKIITALAALETESISPKKRFYCAEKFILKGYRDREFYCHDRHNSLNLYQAIAESCNIYFYNLGYLIGPTIILKYADYLGLNDKTGIDLPGEKSGFIPSRKWKLKTYGQSWFDGDTINLSIGQGFISVTLLGMANLLAGLINKGIIYRPYLVKEIRSADNLKVIKKISRDKIREVPLSDFSLEVIKKGMRLGVLKGTSRRLSFLDFPVAGKTGTVQTRSNRKEKKSQHAWFIGYGPYGDQPEEDSFIVAVIVEHGISGSVAAVPIAARVFQKLADAGYLK